MQAAKPDHLSDEQIEELTESLESGTFAHVKRMLNGLPPDDIAHLIESSPPPSRQILWTLIDDEQRGAILPLLADDVQAQFVQAMDAAEVVALTANLETDDMVDVLQHLPGRVISEVLQSMRTQDRQRAARGLSFPEDTAGGLMNTDTITVRARHSVDVVLRYLRRHDEIPASTDKLFVVNREDELIGELSLSSILTSDPNNSVREIMLTDAEAIDVNMHADEITQLFERKDWVSAPVVNEHGRLLGRITIDDVVDVIREDADHSLMSMAGLDDEDTFSTLWRTTPRRMLWLGINLLTVFVASFVIDVFHDVIDKVVALAILMPIVASMGGVAGTQTLTIVVRGLAVGHIEKHNRRWLIGREFRIGIINAIVLASIVAVAAVLWFDDTTIGIIIAAAMVINLITAALAGAILPLALHKLRIDPALAGGVVLTTVTDVVGFMSFLGLATFFYA